MTEFTDLPAPSWVRHRVAELPVVQQYPVFMSPSYDPEFTEDVRVHCVGCDSMSPARVPDGRSLLWRHVCPGDWLVQ